MSDRPRNTPTRKWCDPGIRALPVSELINQLINDKLQYHFAGEKRMENIKAELDRREVVFNSKPAAQSESRKFGPSNFWEKIDETWAEAAAKIALYKLKDPK